MRYFVSYYSVCQSHLIPCFTILFWCPYNHPHHLPSFNFKISIQKIILLLHVAKMSTDFYFSFHQIRVKLRWGIPSGLVINPDTHAKSRNFYVLFQHPWSNCLCSLLVLFYVMPPLLIPEMVVGGLPLWPSG